LFHIFFYAFCELSVPVSPFVKFKELYSLETYLTLSSTHNYQGWPKESRARQNILESA
ncbi:hypothetical protein ACTXT7_013008, partial [Hymenolepis weldensis]